MKGRCSMSDNMNTRAGRRRAREQIRKEKQPKKRGLFKRLMLIGLSLFLVAAVVVIISVITIIAKAPEIDPAKLDFPQAAEIFDNDGESISQLTAAENRIRVQLDEVPDVVKDAFIATEDVRFYDHMGVDVRRMGGALLANITGGFGSEGASTITQQLVKLAIIENPEKTISRKVQEQYLAVKLEQQYTKDQILEMYMNIIFLGNSAYGVGKGAATYFDKDISELTTEDAAILAAIPRRPSYYDPFKHPENVEKRRNLVISLMEQHGKITKEEAERAKSVAIEDQIKHGKKDDNPYQAFIDVVLSEVENMEGMTTEDLYTGGLKIYTTLDRKAQDHVEAVLQTEQFIKGYPNNEDFQAGVTVVDTKTGAIKAIGSGRHKTEVQRGFNYATDIRKQPGSTIKPIVDYAPAIEYKQWGTGQIIVDEPHSYTNGPAIRNYSRNYDGPVTMRKALTKSLNIPAIKALQAVGTEQAQKFAEGIGIPFEDEPMTEAYGLGGFKTGISTVDLAGAYAAFGNEGIYHEPYTVRKIEFPNGHVIDTVSEPVVAMKDYTAYMVADMMKSVVREGTGTRANISGLPLAGKTGTTNFADETKKKYKIPSDGVPDSWFGGFTTNYSIAVWTGYDRFGEKNYLNSNDRRLAMQIFKSVMTELSKGKDTSDFKQPNSVVKVGIEKTTGKLPGPFTPESEIVYELFVRGHEPTEVSNAYTEIPAPNNVSASYNEEADQIQLSWAYPDVDSISFKVLQSVDGSHFEPVYSGKELTFTITQPKEGSTYDFQVIAFLDDSPTIESDPATVQVQVQLKELITDPIEDIIDDLEGLPPNLDEDEEKDRDKDKNKNKDKDEDKENQPSPSPAPTQGNVGEGEQ